MRFRREGTDRAGLIGPLLVSAALSLSAAPGLQAEPLPEADVAHGIERINAGDYRGALDFLERAAAAEPGNPEALFYAGLAHSRLGAYRNAEKFLKGALALGESPEIRYELGRVAALGGRCADAEAEFARFGALGGDAAMARDGGTLVEECRGQVAKRSFRLAFTWGWQHDSNVILDPERPVVETEGPQSDQRALGYLTLGGVPLRGRSAELDLEYAVYGSIHEKLEDYNVLYQKLTPVVNFTAWDRLRPSLGGLVEYTLFGAERYSLAGAGFGKIALREGERALTELVGEWRTTTYEDTELFPDNAERSGTTLSASLRQVFTSSRAEVSLQAAAVRDDAEKDYWSSQGFRAGGRLLWRMVGPIYLGLASEYQRYSYREAFPATDEKREDSILSAEGTLSWVLSRRDFLTLTVSHTRDDSNLDAFTYKRTIIGVLVSFAI